MLAWPRTAWALKAHFLFHFSCFGLMKCHSDPGLSKLLPLCFLFWRIFGLLNSSASSLFSPHQLLLSFSLGFSTVFGIVCVCVCFSSCTLSLRVSNLLEERRGIHGTAYTGLNEYKTVFHCQKQNRKPKQNNNKLPKS